MNRMTVVKRRVLSFLILICILSVTSCNSQGVTSVEKQNTKEEVSTSAESEDGSFEVDITLEGGSGKAFIKSPVLITRTDGRLSATLVWNSKNYDYMIVDNVRYDNENEGGESTFTVPIATLDEPLKVIGDTVAMSKPHEIEYTIYFNKKSDDNGDELSVDVGSYKNSLPQKIAGYEKSGELSLKYATGFGVYDYGPYKFISIFGSGDFLLVPKDADIPNDIPDSVTVLKQPLDRTYLVSSSVMDYVCRCNALDNIALSGTEEEDWSIDEAKNAMHEGKILYAGKYRTPDYELILSSGCDLAIENTMIYHEPEVKEKLEELGIPVMVETSSYEKHPLGRLEWIKLYGILFDATDTADKYFADQLEKIEPVMESPDTDVTVAFFYVTTSGLINVRKPGDYISKMIDLAGGNYALNSDLIKADNSLSTMNMQMEDFYASACNADIIIYNSTIAGEIGSVDELISKNTLFADFKAVKDKKVYCTDHDLFQQTTKVAEFLSDLNAVINGDERELYYLRKLD